VPCDVRADIECACRGTRRCFHAVGPSKGAGGAAQRLVSGKSHVPRDITRDVLPRFVCSLDDRDGRLGVWAGAKVRCFPAACHVTWWRGGRDVLFRLDLLAPAWAGHDALRPPSPATRTLAPMCCPPTPFKRDSLHTYTHTHPHTHTHTHTHTYLHIPSYTYNQSCYVLYNSLHPHVYNNSVCKTKT
jgi:hypothetical protein